MSAVGGGRNFVYTSATYFATVDPMVVIDPTFADIGLYTITISPEPVGQVPEPATFVLLGAGLIVLLGKSRSVQAKCSLGNAD
jgi:dTDP-4-amino-4,6-dideoxygalactose transaminase